MNYQLFTAKSWQETLDDLHDTFDKWGVRSWDVTGKPPRRDKWGATT